MLLFSVLEGHSECKHSEIVLNTVKILKNREFESLRPRIWREIAEKKRELEKTASLEPRVCEGLVYRLFQEKNQVDCIKIFLILFTC